MNRGTTLVQLTDHVWMYPPAADKALLQPAIGVICTSQETVLYDAGNSPAHAQRLRHALDAIQAPPVRLVVYSHHHWDHIFGGQVWADAFPGVQLIAHRTCYERTCELAARGWNRAYVQRMKDERPIQKAMYEMLEQMIEWETFRVVLPNQVFDTPTCILPLASPELTLEVEHVGGEHADDSTVLRVTGESDEKVLFMADCFYPKPLTRGATSDKTMIQRFLNEKQAFYIDGHNGRIWRNG